MAGAVVYLDPARYGDQELKNAAIAKCRTRVRDAIVKDPSIAPSFFLLAGGFASMVRAGSLIKGGSAAESLLIALPTGINAAWLAAATGIGFTLVAQNTYATLASPEAGAVLLGGVVAGACYAVPTFLGRSTALGLGYGAATCWACFGMTKGDAPQVVKDVATYGGYLVAVVSAAALMRPRPAPPADGLLAEAPKRGGSV